MLSKNQARDIRALHLKKFREARARFIAEGAKTVTEIINRHPELIESLFADAAFLEANANTIKQHNISSTQITEDELRTISLQSNPNRVLAVCKQIKNNGAGNTNKQPFTFFLDDIRDPGNFGTIIRLCDWFGVRDLYCSPECCELYNPKVIQSSMGAFLRVEVTYMPLTDLVAQKKPRYVYGAALEGKDLYTEKLEEGIIIIGNEANGISAENMKLVNRPVTIPAHSNNGSESLNAAMATGIIASEFYRQMVHAPS